MKWHHSIITKISLIFLLAIFGVLSILFLLTNRQTQKDLRSAERFARFAIHSSYSKENRELDLKKLKTSGLILIKDENLRKQILSRRNFFRTHFWHENTSRRVSKQHIKPIIYNKKIYITLRQRHRRVLLFETPFKIGTFSPLLISFLSIFLVILLYIMTIKNILPLYTLKKKINRFANGDYDIDCKSKNMDEIGILANEFNEAVQKIKNLRDSRQLFIRNLMHELKTPITKGRFAVEITQNQELKQTLQNIFNRQEYLIEEFAKIEKLNANELQLEKKEYLLEDIIDFAQDILNHDNSKIIKNITPIKVFVDFEFFGTALKNLLDNGINYSIDSKVTITNSEEKITISNIGKELEFPLQNYAQPYFLNGKKQKSSRGLGFGLYIVWHILKLHNMKIIYKRDADKNLFEILLK